MPRFHISKKCGPKFWVLGLLGTTETFPSVSSVLKEGSAQGHNKKVAQIQVSAHHRESSVFKGGLGARTCTPMRDFRLDAAGPCTAGASAFGYGMARCAHRGGLFGASGAVFRLWPSLSVCAEVAEPGGTYLAHGMPPPPPGAGPFPSKMNGVRAQRPNRWTEFGWWAAGQGRLGFGGDALHDGDLAAAHHEETVGGGCGAGRRSRDSPRETAAHRSVSTEGIEWEPLPMGKIL